jgi:hypothetical protein
MLLNVLLLFIHQLLLLCSTVHSQVLPCLCLLRRA